VRPEGYYALVADLGTFCSSLQYDNGHAHLYQPFQHILVAISAFRTRGSPLDADLAGEILTTVDLLLRENDRGRRPWADSWEEYFKACMKDALLLVRQFCEFPRHLAHVPPGFCNRFLDAFLVMDRHDREYIDNYPEWASHFRELAAMAAEMFSLFGDEHARIDEGSLEHPDDATFKHLLTGFAKARTSEAESLVRGFARDDESWVRSFSQDLHRRYYQ
jgi:hypothetical protein